MMQMLAQSLGGEEAYQRLNCREADTETIMTKSKLVEVRLS